MTDVSLLLSLGSTRKVSGSLWRTSEVSEDDQLSVAAC